MFQHYGTPGPALFDLDQSPQRLALAGRPGGNLDVTVRTQTDPPLLTPEPSAGWTVVSFARLRWNPLTNRHLRTAQEGS
jgi:hypothetical protein